jgi:hypothetical protein
MNWLRKSQCQQKTTSGLEWRLWRKLPLILLAGTALPACGLGLLHALADGETAIAQRWLQTADFMVMGAVVFHWTVVFTVAIGCAIVMVMKGPAYEADSFPVSHRDQPL